jgi:hypothetical protein
LGTSLLEDTINRDESLRVRTSGSVSDATSK